MLLHGPYAKKNLRILFSENVVIVQTSSKCPGLSVRSVSLNKACRVAVVFAHEGISELENCVSMICRLPVGSNKTKTDVTSKTTHLRGSCPTHDFKVLYSL